MTPDETGAAELALPAGRYDAMVVDAEWVLDTGGATALALSVVLMSGESKGTVVDTRFFAGSPALDAALRACGVDPTRVPADPEVCTAMLAMPCTLVVAHDSTRGTGLALTPP